MARRLLAAFLAGCALTGTALAQVAVSANDGKAVLSENGQTVVPLAPLPDSVTVYRLGGKLPQLIGEVQVPTSVVGPPQSVAIAPDESYALVTAATKLDPADPSKTVPNDTVSVVDLKTLSVVQTVQAGPGASGVSINRAGTLALVANRVESTVSVFTIAGGRLSAMGKVFLEEDSSPALAVFTPDGSRALLTRDGDSRISVLAIDGAKVTDTGYAIYAGLRPYAIEMSGKGDYAVVANIGIGGHDNDSISLINMNSVPVRVVDTQSVAPSPEGLAVSGDGKFIAVSSLNGSNFARGELGAHDGGILQIFQRDGLGLKQVAFAPVGRFCEGTAWSADHRQLLLQCMADKEIEVFAFDGHHLRRTGALAVPNGPAGIRVADSAAGPARAERPVKAVTVRKVVKKKRRH
ncbi:MAG: YncE family protein [Rhizomicrobium sp.]